MDFVCCCEYHHQVAAPAAIAASSRKMASRLIGAVGCLRVHRIVRSVFKPPQSYHLARFESVRVSSTARSPATSIWPYRTAVWWHQLAFDSLNADPRRIPGVSGVLVRIFPDAQNMVCCASVGLKRD